MTIRGFMGWLGLALMVAGRGLGQTTLPCADADKVARQDASIRTLVSAVDVLVSRFEIDQAMALVTQDLVEHPNDTRLEDARGRVLYRNGQLAEAIDAFNLAIEIDPCNGRAHYDAWRVEAMAGMWEQAQQQLDIAHTVYPTVELFQRLWRNTQMKDLPSGVVADQPPHFNFYAWEMDCDGIVVRAAAVVNPAALPAACGHIRRMLEKIPNVRANLVARGAELHIMGEDQHISDLPEARNERGEKTFVRAGDAGEKVDIDALAGATGGIYANCPEINLLHLRGDGYGVHDEVCVHEFAHDIMNAGFDARMQDEIASGYKASMKKGLWKGAYAATNAQEWWAEMSAWYFGAQGGVSRMQPPIPDAGPEALKAYDPGTYALVDRMYSGVKQPKVVHETLLKPVRQAIGSTGLAPSEAEVLFVNNGPVRRYLFWVDNGGVAHVAGLLEPYSRQLIRDYDGRNWMILDARTKDHVLYHVTDDESEIVVE